MQSAMQCDADGNLSPDQADDQDSLFGSPPASPARGRSPSPALALPSARISTQNVGTIALPGSQHCSELPVTPLALSLNYALNEHPQRPPALPTTAILSGNTTPSSSRASSTGPGNRSKKRTERTGRNSKSKEPTPRPPPPEIAFPDPSGPVPANFLRSQSALLGYAGLVSGVKPSNLSTGRQTPGTAASNPIVIDDDDRVPRHPSRSSTQPSSEKLGIDPSVLPTPSTQEIMSILMGEKDTFLVLQSLLRLIAGMDRPHTPESAPLTSFRRTSRSFQPSGFGDVNTAQPPPEMSHNSFVTSNLSAFPAGPPLKKRRLNRVPAGAVDWDVPYPFLEGHGPEAYSTNWERERGMQLMSQLVTLVKDAIRKAATRKHLQNEREKRQLLEWERALARPSLLEAVEEPKVHGHYRPSTITYGLQGEAAAAARAQVQKVLTDASNSVKPSTTTSLPTRPPHPLAQSWTHRTSTHQPSTPFDQLITSLLAATPGQNAIADVQNASSTPNNKQDLDQGLFDNWMNIFQTFLLPKNLSPSNHNSLPSETDTSASTPVSIDSSFFDLDSTSADMDPVDLLFYDYESIFNTGESTLSTPGPSHTSEQPESSSTQDNEPVVSHRDIIIDPALLAISVPKAPAVSASAAPLEPPPSLRGSPIPSLSSFGDVDPPTPNSAAWDISTPEVVIGSGGDVPIAEGLVGGGCRRGGLAGQEEHLKAFIEAQSVDKGKGREMGDRTAQASRLPSTVQSEILQSSVASFPPLRMSRDQQRQDQPQGRKAAIMKRAAERKKQLIAALVSVRTQLWETTIEQGVLSHMNKLCTRTA